MKQGDIPVDIGLFADPESAEEFGLLVGEDTKAPFGTRWDPVDGADVLDFGWIGEDGKGVWMRRHPIAALLEFPKLWAIVDEFRYGSQEIQPGEYDSRSAYEMEARVVMAMAFSRDLGSQAGGEN